MPPKESQTKPQQHKKSTSSSFQKPKTPQRSGEKQIKSYQKKDSVIELSKFINQRVRVKFAGGREAIGVLKGFDPLVNLVLDDCVELLRDPTDLSIVTSNTRKIGLVVCRGTSVIVVAPLEGFTEIANPFTPVQQS